MLNEIKRNLKFHQEQIKRFKDCSNQKQFHKGAAMAFSKCEDLYSQPPNQEVTALCPCAIPHLFETFPFNTTCRKCNKVAPEQD